MPTYAPAIGRDCAPARSAPLATRLPRHVVGAERAFTMIEILVAMILLALVLGLVGNTLVQAIGGGSSARSGEASDAAIARAVATLSDDVAQAVTQDRHDSKLRDPSSYAAALQGGETPTSDNPADNGRVLDIDDIVMATGAELRLRSDVLGSAGVECVTWRASTNGGYRIERLVDPAGTCGAGQLSRKTYVSAPAGVPGLDATPFSYQLMCNRSLCPGAPPADPPSATCRTWTTDQLSSTTQLRWIVSVDASFVNVTDDRAASIASGTTTMTVRSRDTESYRRALGC